MAPHRVALIAFDDLTALDLVGPMDVLDTAGRVAAKSADPNPHYRLEVLSIGGARVRASNGLQLQPDGDLTRATGPFDTLLVAGGRGARAFVEDRAAVGQIKRLARRSRRVASVCTGAFILAAAGVLDGKRAVTHWAACAALARTYPDVSVEVDPIFVRDGHTYTSAGVTAGLDLALAFVEADLGRDVALRTARQLVLFIHRPGGQSQFSTQLGAQLAERDPLRSLTTFIVDNVAEDLSVSRLAARVALSERQFSRVFKKEIGVTPGSFVEKARVDVARRLLETTGVPIPLVAEAAGFGSAPTLRRVFSRHLGVAPTAYRERFRSPGGQP